ncbi:MAG TPA: tail fiber domain-containing protein [Longimicrobiales bacterium]|nr:tail fiber domain-containing protein [Longimicrobiales bacterium]
MFPRAYIVAAVLAAPLLLDAAPAAAQSDILLRLRSGSPAGDRVRVDSAGGFVAMGTLGIGIIPATGCGYRMMWYPFRGAFRAGTTDDGGACTYWDDANIGFYSWAGGNLSRATGFASFAFGDQVTVTGTDGAAFGGSNTVSGTVGFAAGANHNCSGFACVTLGYNNTATGQGSTAIGYRTTADANYATAIGYRASVNGRTGAFVISDASTTDSTEASANNQFRARFAGGYRFYTNSSQTVGVSLAASGNAWASISDRNRKENIEWLDGEDVLSRLRHVPVGEWNYIDSETDARNIGPMAQDWHAAFPLNDDTLSINQADFAGVNLAGIRALEMRTTEQAARIRTLEADQARQAAEIAELRELLRALTEARRP